MLEQSLNPRDEFYALAFSFFALYIFLNSLNIMNPSAICTVQNAAPSRKKIFSWSSSQIVINRSNNVLIYPAIAKSLNKF